MIRSNRDIQWPPDYTVKQHPRARHVKLKTSRQKGLQLVVPPRFNLKDIPAILEKHRPWIEKQLDQHAHTLNEALPIQITLAAFNQSWQVEYIATDTPLQIIDRPHQSIVLLGKIENKLACQQLLTGWVKAHAKRYLSEALQKVSQEIGLTYEQLTLRDQKTRWGSCSREKSINLNYKLIFFSATLMRHILIHELCHTVHLNHSDKFWRLVEQFDPEWREHRRLIRKAQTFIPSWVI